jgi:hypothetical protein
VSAAIQRQTSARRLRRTVAELCQCSIEDIEAVWNALSPAERAQLSPLLAETSNHAGAAAGLLDEAGKPGIQTTANDRRSPVSAGNLALACQAVPNELMSRLLSCVDPQTRNTVLGALPADRQSLMQPTRAYAMTETARTALLEAAMAALEHVDATGSASASKPAKAGQRFRAWFGRKV